LFEVVILTLSVAEWGEIPVFLPSPSPLPLPLPLPRLGSARLGSASKIKLNLLSYFQLAKKCLFYHHVYHTLDHVLTTKTPRSTVRFFPNPLYLRAFRSPPPRAEKPLQFLAKNDPETKSKIPAS
jgi:hypothetical protein